MNHSEIAFGFYNHIWSSMCLLFPLRDAEMLKRPPQNDFSKPLNSLNSLTIISQTFSSRPDPHTVQPSDYENRLFRVPITYITTSFVPVSTHHTSSSMASTFTLALLATLSFATSANADVLVSIFSYTPYLQQRECVKDCIWHSGSTARDLIVALGCSGPWVNECYCNGDYEQASTASSFLESCVVKSCPTSSRDALVTSALGVYNEYCAGAGMAIPLVVATATGVTTRSGEVVTGAATGAKSGGNGGPTAGFGDQHGPGSGSSVPNAGEFGIIFPFLLNLSQIVVRSFMVDILLRNQVYPPVPKLG